MKPTGSSPNSIPQPAKSTKSRKKSSDSTKTALTALVETMRELGVQEFHGNGYVIKLGPKPQEAAKAVQKTLFAHAHAVPQRMSGEVPVQLAGLVPR